MNSFIERNRPFCDPEKQRDDSLQSRYLSLKMTYRIDRHHGEDCSQVLYYDQTTYTPLASRLARIPDPLIQVSHANAYWIILPGIPLSSATARATCKRHFTDVGASKSR